MKKEIDYNVFISNFENEFKNEGYTKQINKFNVEDFSYWKSFKDEKGKSLYQIGVLFYDYRSIGENLIRTRFQCSILIREGVEMTVNRNISLHEFQEMAIKFFKSFH